MGGMCWTMRMGKVMALGRADNSSTRALGPPVLAPTAKTQGVHAGSGGGCKVYD